MNKKEFKDLFLKLTEYTIPYGHESKLEKYLPTGFKKDSIGNYYYEIGNSTTLFTTHLDTFSGKYEKVNHVIEDYIIKTDGTTILGGDNKLGTTILIGMIENKIPGVYYFFLGEEPILSGGLYGSRNALKSNTEYFKKFKRCIAFDRREYGSIVVRQMGRMCCSKDFAEKIADEFDIRGIKWDQTGGFGYYTDTAVFMDVIEECTNISAGGFHEHYKKEWVDLNYTYEVYKTALDVDWESLPVVRELEQRFDTEEKNSMPSYLKFNQKNNEKDIDAIFSLLGIYPTRGKTTDGVKHITYSKWLEDIDFDIYLNGSKIILNEEEVTMSDLLENVYEIFAEDIIEEILHYQELSKGGLESANKNLSEFKKVFKQKNLDEFINYLGDFIE